MEDGRKDNGGKREGAGRPPGSPNRIPRAVKEMVLDALDELGGSKYLKEQGEENATAFMTLIGKIIPLQIANAEGETFKTEQSIPAEDKEILEHYISLRKADK